MSQQTDANNVYRDVAKFVENTALEALTAYFEIPSRQSSGACSTFRAHHLKRERQSGD
jgi:hypothetical protein